MRTRQLVGFVLICLFARPALAADANTLPLRQGYYVLADTPCNNASNATLSLLGRSGFGTSHTDGAFVKIVPAGPGSWRITSATTDVGSGHRELTTDTIKIDSSSAYTLVNGIGSYSYRLCPQRSLPEPWRSNDISSYINLAAGAPAQAGAAPGGTEGSIGAGATAGRGPRQAVAHWGLDHSPSGNPIARLAVVPAMPIKAAEFACLDGRVAVAVLVGGPTRLAAMNLVFAVPGKPPVTLSAPRMGLGRVFATTLPDPHLIDFLMAGVPGADLSIGKFTIDIAPVGAAPTLSQALAKCYRVRAR